MTKSSNGNVYFENLLKAFTETFASYKEKRIALYGIGAFSATVIERLEEYNIVGLLDRDPNNIGKILYGVPILSKEQAEEQADIIIINTEASYWQTIYKRIRDIKIPVYYRNGQKAYIIDEKKYDSDLEYWETSKEKLLKDIDSHSVISFDIFDTLLTRQVYLPADVFQLIELRLKHDWNLDFNFSELRIRALHTTGVENPNYDEIYDQFQVLSKLDRQTVEQIKEYEFQLERQLLVVRKDVVDLFEYAKKKQKKIILTSDMYYSSEQLQVMLQEQNITGYDNLFVSCEYRKSKRNGDLYDVVLEQYDKKEVLHIGDDKHNDYNQAKNKGIDASYIMSGRTLLAHSSINEIIPQICTVVDSVVIGTVIARIFNSPFALNMSKGLLRFEEATEVGYAVFAPLIFGFTHWLYQTTQDDKIQELLFFARDGYFLKDYFNQLQDYCKPQEKVEADYFFISRRLAAVASINDEASFLEVAQLPYQGSFAEYMEKRWNVLIDKDDDWYTRTIHTTVAFDELLEHMKQYTTQIQRSIECDKIHYKKYCEDKITDKRIGIVDTWYYGNCQWYLSRIINQSIPGYYFGVNLLPQNRNNQYNKLCACYNDSTNPAGNGVNCLKYSLHFESIFTAPHGMVRNCMDGNQFFYEPKGKNQQEFSIREEMDKGVKVYLEEVMNILGAKVLSNEKFQYSFCDKLYGCYWNDGIQLAKEIQTKLYNENYFQSSQEFLIIE